MRRDITIPGRRSRSVSGWGIWGTDITAGTIGDTDTTDIAEAITGTMDIMEVEFMCIAGKG